MSQQDRCREVRGVLDLEGHPLQEQDWRSYWRWEVTNLQRSEEQDRNGGRDTGAGGQDFMSTEGHSGYQPYHTSGIYITIPATVVKSHDWIADADKKTRSLFLVWSAPLFASVAESSLLWT